MEITYLDAIILHLLNKLNGERTVYAIYHLLHGKRSSQTIQDAHLYQLTPFFYSYPFITRSELEKIVEALLEKGMAAEVAETKVILTEKGYSALTLKLAAEPLPTKLNGWKYHQVTDLFWERLTLLTQVSSNLIHKERHFIPVRNKKELLEWVKHYISQQEADRYQLAENLYRELEDALDGPFTKPELLVIRLSGYKKIGMTPVQAAECSGLDPARYHFEFLNTMHAMLDKITDKTIRFPLLSGLIKQADQEVPLTQSTKRTYKLLKKGYTIEQISAARNLKESTVEDHIVEIVLSIKDFKIDPYVLPEKQKRIIESVKRISAKRLKQIREQVQDASYFEIRLVLAKYGDDKWT
jgi:uncharacterized protein YpbB